MIRPMTIGLLVASLAGFIPAMARAQEHPEHPESGSGSEEHPEHPEKKPGKAKALTTEALSMAIQAYVKEQSPEGSYRIDDPVSGEALDLELTKVHEERLSRVGEDLYFACADFESEDGTVYDLDFFMRGKTADALQFSDVSIHKVSGEPRYTWHEENGLWVKKSTAGADSPDKAGSGGEAGDDDAEHPEHPEHPE